MNQNPILLSGMNNLSSFKHMKSIPIIHTICFAAFIVISTISNAQTYIRTNQLGYLPNDSKIAVAFSQSVIESNFEILDIYGKILTTGTLKKSKLNGYSEFENQYTLDFSELTEAGEYTIKINQSTQQFKIDSHTYMGIPDVLLNFMRQQRCGYNPFFDQVCHTKDGRLMYGSLPDSSFTDVSGGWHDAGDQLKYLITGSNATARMLMAYQLFPTAFKDEYNSLGQPMQNNIPDVIDEAKWGLDWILKCHYAKDQLVHQVADDRDHVGWKFPFDDPSNYGWGKNSYRVAYSANGKPQGLNKYKSQATGIANLAGRSAAALALGYQVWNTNHYDQSFAAKCLQSAEELYQMAKSNPGYQQGNSYSAPYRYNEDTWTDDMEWAAAELYRATKKKTYLKDAKKYALMTGELSWIQKDTSAHYQFYPFLNIAHFSFFEFADRKFKEKLATFYKNGIDQTIRQRASKNTYSIGVPFIWCSNNLLVDLGLQIYLYERMTGDTQYHPYMIAMRDWLLGKNPWGTSMFMNIPVSGTYPHDVHTSTWALTHKEVSGGLADGPIYYSTYQKQLGLTLTHPDAFAPFQNKYVVYHDDIGDYCTNEPTMDGTACAIMFLACFGK
ncbi:MAG: glycoside hydrolase family 9 protein [Saprospiraceae bacterium]